MTDAVTNAQVNEEAGASEATVSGADELERALAQYEAERSEPAPIEQANAPEGDDLAAKVSQFEKFMEEQKREAAQREVQTALDDAVATVRGDSSLDENLIKGQLYLLSQENEQFNVAYANRQSDPEGWNKVLTAVRKTLDESLGSVVDANVSSDVAAVRTAAQTQTNAVPSEPEFNASKVGKMSDAEFAEFKKGLS